MLRIELPSSPEEYDGIGRHKHLSPASDNTELVKGQDHHNRAKHAEICQRPMSQDHAKMHINLFP